MTNKETQNYPPSEANHSNQILNALRAINQPHSNRKVLRDRSSTNKFDFTIDAAVAGDWPKSKWTSVKNDRPK